MKRNKVSMSPFQAHTGTFWARLPSPKGRILPCPYWLRSSSRRLGACTEDIFLGQGQQGLSRRLQSLRDQKLKPAPPLPYSW